ncbi:MAG: 2,5-dichloro-2,5-cyclohexadiene,4-diol dehydrogenase, partial [Acidimicrobiia bacterium]|nr:2,5-dichloro-2,5-cyclohexadiene,4-diol dehydrogenase [Acidimicrobiia bacterium]
MFFSDKVAVVTGAASGLGEACARKLAAEGAAVVVADVDVDNGTRVVAEITALGGRSSFVATDVTQPEAVAAMVRHAIDTHGGLDLAVNNAGLGHTPAPFHELALETFDGLLALNLRGVILCMREELAQFVDLGPGAIVNMASVSGEKGSAGMGAYVATKHAV